jgi:hypothetical protein
MDGRVDFDKVRTNAAEQGIPLTEIAILYEDLNAEQVAALKEQGLVAYPNENGPALVGRFKADGGVMFPEKATGIYSLAA